MANITELTRIALADANATEARQIIQSLLRADASSEAYGKIATALRAWIWKTLTSRRHDSELANWHDMLRRLSVSVRGTDQNLATRFQLLSELVHESIVSPEIADPKSVLRRSHVRKALELLTVADDGRMERSDLGIALSLQQANLTRIINMLVASGLVIKTSEGRRVIVELTHAGKQEAHALLSTPQTAAKPQYRPAPLGQRIKVLEGKVGDLSDTLEARKAQIRGAVLCGVLRRGVTSQYSLDVHFPGKPRYLDRFILRDEVEEFHEPLSQDFSYATQKQA